MNFVKQVERLPALPERPSDAHKGTFGKVLVFAGSLGMTGAAVLAGQGALRGGAGLVFVAASEDLISTIAGAEPSYLTIPLEMIRQGVFGAEAGNVLAAKFQEMSAGVIGPGLGRSSQRDLMIAKLYAETECPLVVDADALNALSKQDKKFAKHSGPRILTPHLVEFARMIGKSVEELGQEGESLAVAFARENKVVLVLKGACSLITDGDQVAINTTGNSGLATGGSGDVLSGIIASLLGQEMQPFEAAQLGVHLHGLAADLAIVESSSRSLIPSDLPRFLGKAYRSLE